MGGVCPEVRGEGVRFGAGEASLGDSRCMCVGRAASSSSSSGGDGGEDRGGRKEGDRDRVRKGKKKKKKEKSESERGLGYARSLARPIFALVSSPSQRKEGRKEGDRSLGYGRVSCQRLEPLPSKSLDNRCYCFRDGSLHEDPEDPRRPMWVDVRACACVCTYVGHRSEEGSLVVSRMCVRGRKGREGRKEGRERVRSE